jgi:tannase/feruloyl esterase
MYYNKVLALLPSAHDFYRHFEVPGMGHCSGGSSGEPTSLFEQLRSWVENGTAPEQTPVKVTDLEGKVHNRILCPYPEKAALHSGCRAAEEACWSCNVQASHK